MLTKLIDELDHLHTHFNYSDYINDANYQFEIFALNHSSTATGGIILQEPPPENLNNMIAYFEQRALATYNKAVRARYNDLIWSYKNKYNKTILVCGNVRDKCESAISDYKFLAKKHILSRDNDEKILPYLHNYLFRAWNLSKQIKSFQQPELIQLMIDIENSIEDDTKIGLWGFSYKELIADKSVLLSSEQQGMIIKKIESRLQTLDSQNYNALEYGIKLLLEYYKDCTPKKEEFLDLLEKNALIKSDRPFENQNRFKNLINLCDQYQLKNHKERAILNYQLYGADITKYTVNIAPKFEITSEKEQELLDELLDKSPYKHFFNIALCFMSSKSYLKKKNEENASEFFLKDLFRTAILNKDGVTTMVLTTEDDELYHNNKIYWQINSFLFKIAIEDFIKTHQLSDESFKNLLFDEALYKNQEKTLHTAVRALYNEDYFSMCYISVPLIENGLRQLLFQCDHSFYEKNKQDGFENVTLTRILTELSEYLDVDFIFHLKFILNEKAGLNLRNEIAHGLFNDSQIQESTAFTLLHTLMILKVIVGGFEE